ncbi:MAG: hypothetical protein KY439_10005, partial [Actinobacteria bacterium]|nr:hypothetical protein [Actinomycetota bacterium]
MSDDAGARQELMARVAAEICPDFDGIFSAETIERFIADSYTSLAATARVPTFLPVLTGRFARERLHALAQAQGALVSDVPEVLFVCVHNAGRSQMAAALLDHHAAGRVHVRSAGSEPGSGLNPAVVEVQAAPPTVPRLQPGPTATRPGSARPGSCGICACRPSWVPGTGWPSSTGRCPAPPTSPPDASPVRA